MKSATIKSTALTICKEKKGLIFGGYSEAEWDSQKKHPKSDKNAFLYPITYDKKFNSKNFEESIECDPNFGPIFGYGGDLIICDDFLSTSNNNVWAHQKTYCDKIFEIRNGNRIFNLNDLEVYLIYF